MIFWTTVDYVRYGRIGSVVNEEFNVQFGYNHRLVEVEVGVALNLLSN